MKKNVTKNIRFWQIISGLLAIVLLVGYFFDVNISARVPSKSQKKGEVLGEDTKDISNTIVIDQEKVIPSNGVVLPLSWGDLGSQLIESGVIDEENFLAIYNERGGLTNEQYELLYSDSKGALVMNQQNSGFLLNLLWAFGLGNKNSILEEGEMQNPEYGGAGGFASTGGWTLADGDAMNHYSMHEFVTLTPGQQEMVERVSKGIYRPCCGNSTHFPDCNHGMAMLGLLQLMASQGVSEADMYDAALAVNSYWFPDTYLTLAKYFAGRGASWDQVDAPTLLSAAYSSGNGYRQILNEVKPIQKSGGGGCGV